MRKKSAITLSILFALLMGLSGCKKLVDDGPEAISIYTTFYPIYALTDAVMSGVPDAELHCLVQPQDGCLRDYALSDWDARLLSVGADAVICGGRGLEAFESTLFGQEGVAVTSVLYNLELYDAGGGSADGEESHLKGVNPHLYMSLKGAAEIVDSVSASMVSLDPRYAERYIENANKARSRLDEAFREAAAALTPFAGQSVILMNEALIYPARDYGLNVVEQIDRESGEWMSDIELKALLERLNGANAKVILIEKQAPQALREALEGAGYAVACMDVMSTHREGEGFERYIELQRENARALEEALKRAQKTEESD